MIGAAYPSMLNKRLYINLESIIWNMYAKKNVTENVAEVYQVIREDNTPGR